MKFKNAKMLHLTHIPSLPDSEVSKWIPAIPPTSVIDIAKSTDLGLVVMWAYALAQRYRHLGAVRATGGVPNADQRVEEQNLQPLIEQVGGDMKDTRAAVSALELLIGSAQGDAEWAKAVIDLAMWVTLPPTVTLSEQDSFEHVNKTRQSFLTLSNDLEDSGYEEGSAAAKMAATILDVGWKADFWGPVLVSEGFRVLGTIKHDDYDPDMMLYQLEFLRNHRFFNACFSALSTYRATGNRTSAALERFRIEIMLDLNMYLDVGMALNGENIGDLCRDWSWQQTRSVARQIIDGAHLTLRESLNNDWSIEKQEYSMAKAAFNLLMTAVDSNPDVNEFCQIGMELSILLDVCMEQNENALALSSLIQHVRSLYDGVQRVAKKRPAHLVRMSGMLKKVSVKHVLAMAMTLKQMYEDTHRHVLNLTIIFAELMHVAYQLTCTEPAKPSSDVPFDLDVQQHPFESARYLAKICQSLLYEGEYSWIADCRRNLLDIWTEFGFAAIDELEKRGRDAAMEWLSGCIADPQNRNDHFQAFDAIKKLKGDVDRVYDMVFNEQHLRQCNVMSVIGISIEPRHIEAMLAIISATRDTAALAKLVLSVESVEGLEQICQDALIEWRFRSADGVYHAAMDGSVWLALEGNGADDDPVNQIIRRFDGYWHVTLLRRHCELAFLRNRNIGGTAVGRGSTASRRKCYNQVARVLKYFRHVCRQHQHNQVFRDFMISFKAVYKAKKGIKDVLVDESLWD